MSNDHGTLYEVFATTGYDPSRILVREDPDRPRFYQLVCLLCPVADHVHDVSTPNNPGYPTVATVMSSAQDHWRRARHPGWVEKP